MDNNNFDISNITDIQGGIYNFANGTMTLIDQDGQEFNFEITKNDYRSYAIKYNSEDVGTIYTGSRKIVLGDKEFSLLSIFKLDDDNKNVVTTLLKPEDLNIDNILDMPPYGLRQTEGYFNIYDGNGNYIQLCYDNNSKNEDGSYNLVDLNYTIDSEGNIKAENIVGSLIKENDKVKEIKIMHSDGVGYDIHKEIDGTFYKLTSPTLPGLQNIKAATINENSISITKANNEILDCTLVPVTTAEGNTIYYVRDLNGKNIAIYNSDTKEIISAGQNNSINLANNSRFTPTADGNSYIDLQQLEVNSLLYDTNSTPPTITLNGYEFNLTIEDRFLEIYKIAGLEGTFFNPTTGQIQLPGQEEATYFATYGNDNTFYSLEGTIPGVNNTTSVILNLDNTDTQTITINGTPYNLQSIEGSNGIYYVQSNSTNVAIYDSTTKQIICTSN